MCMWGHAMYVHVSYPLYVYRYTRIYLLLVGVSVLVRPTGILLWTPLVLAHLAMKATAHGMGVIQEMFIVGCVVHS